MKRFILIVVLSVIGLEAFAQQDSTTVELKNDMINDYSMIGVNYGVTFSNMYYSPTKHNRGYVVAPSYVSVTYTKHCKMFGNMPFFALVVGAAMGNEGFTFKEDKLTGAMGDVDGANWCSMRVFEIPAMAQIHIDKEPVKILANAGIYGGWRQSITRKGPYMDPQWSNSFKSYENQIDYGFQGGAGFALMFDPVEIHFNCLVRWSWSSLYEPDYKSSYYYNYAYPLDIMATVGVHFQLTKRRGKTNHQLKQEAYRIVYGEN